MKTHIVGIKGAGLSALANILHASGEEICGSDVAEEFFTDKELADKGVRIEQFSRQHVIGDALGRVIYSTAWKDSDEVKAARERGIPTISYAEALGVLFNKHRVKIAVAGSHGKTTTTALVAHILKSANVDITAVVGSTLVQYGTNAFVGKGEIAVIEADEYENKFIYYEPTALLVTSIDYDHPDFFPDPRSYDEAFVSFAARVIARKGKIIACADDKGALQMVTLFQAQINNSIITYGTNPLYAYAVADIAIENGYMHFTLLKKSEKIGRYSIGLPGKHNVLNALGAIALCDTLGLVPADVAAEHAAKFVGTARRFEYKGTVGNTLVYDDFAHHPTEIAATLRAARELFPQKRIWCVFMAHTYSRTKTFFSEFSESFSDADNVLVLDIYGSAREQSGGVHGRVLTDAIAQKTGNAVYVGTHDAALRQIKRHIDEIDILITMGAGDAYKIGEELLCSKI